MPIEDARHELGEVFCCISIKRPEDFQGAEGARARPRRPRRQVSWRISPGASRPRRVQRHPRNGLANRPRSPPAVTRRRIGCRDWRKLPRHVRLLEHPLGACSNLVDPNPLRRRLRESCGCKFSVGGIGRLTCLIFSTMRFVIANMGCDFAQRPGKSRAMAPGSFSPITSSALAPSADTLALALKRSSLIVDILCHANPGVGGVDSALLVPGGH